MEGSKIGILTILLLLLLLLFKNFVLQLLKKKKKKTRIDDFLIFVKNETKIDSKIRGVGASMGQNLFLGEGQLLP